MIRAALACAGSLLALSTMAHAQGAKVYAAESLRAAFEEASSAFSAWRAGAVSFEFGPSGLLKDRLMRGEVADVFASSSTEHPRVLFEAGRAEPMRVFARNRLCALAPASLGATTQNLLPLMLSPKVKLGISTPRADPAGDYAWQVFEKAAKLEPGAYETLSGKALKLVGGANAPAPPPGRNIYATLVSKGQADIFLTYCTNAAAARKEDPGLAMIALPDALAVGAEYGLVVLKGASPTGHAFANFLLGDEGRRILESYGFSRPGP